MQQTSENRCATRRNTCWDIVIATTLCAPNKKEVTIQVLRLVIYILRAGELVWGSDSNTQLSHWLPRPSTFFSHHTPGA